MKIVTSFNVIALSAALILTSCSKGDKGSDGISKEGNCTDATISAYNDINSKGRMYSLTLDKSYLTGLKNSCDSFKSLVGTSSCNAINLKTNETTSVSSATVEPICSKAAEILNAKPVEESRIQACATGVSVPYMLIGTYVSLYATTNDTKYVTAGAQSCDDFEAAIGKELCTVINTKTSLEEYITKTSADSECRGLRNIIENQKKADAEKLQKVEDDKDKTVTVTVTAK